MATKNKKAGVFMISTEELFTAIKAVNNVRPQKPDLATRLENTKNDIADFNRQLNDLDSLIAKAQDQKKVIRRKISKKTIYKLQLIADLEETAG